MNSTGVTMDTIALVMAGGRGERMRSSGQSVPKPLVRVRGVPLLERSLYPLFRDGFDEIVISVPAELPAIGDFVASRGRTFATSVGARLELIEERRPLGNIGCAGLLLGRASTVLVVYADNLTSLDLLAVLARHRDAGASLTLATHVESFRSSYGELTVVDGRVIDYREKPEHPVLVSSAVCVLGPAAVAAAAQSAPLGLVDLFTSLIRRGEEVAEFRHEAPWVDVNDAATVDRAEALVAKNLAPFERWADPPSRLVACAWIVGDDGVLVRRVAGELTDGPMWTLPSVDELSDLPLTPSNGVALAEFDDLDDAIALVARHAVLRFDPLPYGSSVPEGMTWLPTDRIAALGGAGLSSPLLRAWAAATVLGS